jgi:hypothetical protein
MNPSSHIIKDDLIHVAGLEFLYKYTAPENAILLLENSKLHFSSPLNFNDPYDCHPLLVKITDEYIYNVIHDSEYKYLLNTKGFIKSPTYISFVKNFSKTQVKEVKIKILPYVKITCFSEDKNNTLMWAHYAKNHSGVCFQFDAKAMIIFLENLRKTSGQPSCLFLKAIYESKRKNYVYGSANDPTPLLMWIKTKSLEWKYENEIRLAILKWEENLLSIPPDLVSRLYLGSQISEEHEKTIIKLCRANFPNTEIYRVGLSDDDFELIEQKI